MDYHFEAASGGERAVFTGQFTFNDNQKFRQVIEHCEKKKPAALTIDLSAIDFIDSAGLGMLLLLRDTCQRLGIALSLEGAQGQVRKIFTISKFDQLFTLH